MGETEYNENIYRKKKREISLINIDGLKSTKRRNRTKKNGNLNKKAFEEEQESKKYAERFLTTDFPLLSIFNTRKEKEGKKQ